MGPKRRSTRTSAAKYEETSDNGANSEQEEGSLGSHEEEGESPRAAKPPAKKKVKREPKSADPDLEKNGTAAAAAGKKAPQRAKKATPATRKSTRASAPRGVKNDPVEDVIVMETEDEEEDEEEDIKTKTTIKDEIMEETDEEMETKAVVKPAAKRRGRPPAIKVETKKAAPVKQEKVSVKVKKEEVQVKDENEEDEVKPRRRGKGKAIAAMKESDDEESEVEQVKDVKKVRARIPRGKAKPTSALDSDGALVSESDSADDVPLKRPARGQPAKGKGKAKKAPAKKPTGKKAAIPKGRSKQAASDDSSDFIASESSDEEDDDDSDEDDDEVAKLKARAAKGKDLVNESSDDDDKPIKAKKSPTKKAQAPKKSPTPRKPRQPKDAEAERKAEKRIAEGSTSAPEDENDYPWYEATYATSGRARCKTCEKTLSKGELIVSIQLMHSRFGMTTYHKHLACTLLNNDVPIMLHGLKGLDQEDLDRVQEYMLANSAKKIDDERVPLSDEHFIKRDILPAAKPSPFLTASLLPYQQEGLAWMKAQEASKYRGGILADEMGMGKTIQAISCMLEEVKVERSKGMLMSGGTLIICPVIACMQWKSEIERFVEANHLKILLYHGPKRTNLASHIASYDVVLTTYSILESEGRKLMQADKVPCQYCKKLFVPEKLVAHNKYFCGPDARKTAKQAKQKTNKDKLSAKTKKLSDDEDSYESEDEEDVKPIKRSVPPPPKKANATKARSALHEIEWTRIILDEAHYIKDKKCSTARSVFRLNSLYRWCLTGTPLQNRIGELFSLVRFLQIDPFAYYECAQCDCKQLDFSIQQGHCKHCEHTAMQHFSSFNKKIVTPIQGYGYVAEGKLAMLRLQNDLLRHVLLRRTKESRADDISLPPKLVRVRRDALDEREKDFYESIYTQSKAQFNTYVSAGTLLNNYAHIFDLLIRLRQAVDHPYLVIYSKSNPALQLPTPEVPARVELPLVDAPAASSRSKQVDEVTCGFCHEPVEQSVESACSHVYCKSCVEEYVSSLPMGAAALCPTCEEPLTVDLSTGKGDDETEPTEMEKEPVEVARTSRGGKWSLLSRLPNLSDFQSSTKIEALMEELHIMKQHDPSAKAIVFSQFVNMLDLIEHRLHLAGLRCVKLSGHMQMAHRDRLLTDFRNDPRLTVFLISLKAGGVALNLTVASHIFLMDPWWNPAAEHQAIDRTHRLGQFKPIRATRFVIANTIEERILKLQEKKQLVFEGTVGSSTAALARLTIEDLRFLFSG